MYCSFLTDYGLERGQHGSNKARYLSRSNPDYDDFLAFRKRALFRKRGKFIATLRICAWILNAFNDTLELSKIFSLFTFHLTD